jgi:membrane associated rhomboid family serine protease
MTVDSNPDSEKKQLYRAVFIPFIFGFLMVLSFVLENGMDWDFHTAGINPRNIKSIFGIFTIIFVHGSWSHLINNLISFELLGTLLFLLYKEIALKTFVISWIANGIILWIIGRDSWHIGASGLIYSIAFFLFFSGLIRKHIPLIAVSLVVAFLYGSMVWHIFPWQLQDPVSWEGHLAGGVTGLFLSVWFKNEGPQKPFENWDEDENIDDFNYSTNEPDDFLNE